MNSVEDLRAQVEIGWVYAGDPGGARGDWDRARERVRGVLEERFPEFRWVTRCVERYVFDAAGQADALVVVETGLEEKLVQGWDYAVVVVPNELRPRSQNFMIGAPSSALEVAVVGARRLGEGERLVESMAGLVLHLLGHLWGLEHAETGPMVPPARPGELGVTGFTEDERLEVVKRLEDVADTRLEERGVGGTGAWFYVRTFFADPRGILGDVAGYAPWKLPLRLRRMTGAAAAPMLLLLLGAEAWEMGANLPAGRLWVMAVGAVLGAAVFTFLGQRLNLVSREVKRSEQVARSQMVLLLSLLAGMAALFVTLWVLVFVTGWVAPEGVVRNWAAGEFGWGELVNLAVFMASIGVLAGALGGALEESSEIKAHLFLDEET